MKDITYKAKQRLIYKIITTIQEKDLVGFPIDELHQRACNQEFFIIGRYEAEKWLINNYGIFAAIEKIQEYEQNNLVEVNTNLGDAEKVCKMLVYILGKEIIQGLNIQGEKFTKKELNRIVRELNAMFF